MACSEDSNEGDTSNVIGAAGGGTPGGGTPGGATPGGATAGAVAGGTAAGGSASGGSAAGGTASGGSASGGGVAGGTTSGGNASGGAAAGGTAGGGTTGGAAGGASDAGGVTGGTTDAGVPDGGGATGGGPALKTKCEGGETMGCSSFKSPSGMEVQFGPYGAAMDPNVGQGFENTVSPSDNHDDCASFASIFGQSEAETEKLLDLKGLDLKLYSVYRPANWKAGEKYPLLTWGNGTCAQPEGYGTLLRFIASHGFVVVAANSRYVGSNSAMIHALDFMFKANDDMKSPYYQKLDLTKVGAMGHSQGGMATVSASSDNRVKAVIIYNGGTSAAKPFFSVSGDKDLFGGLSDYKSGVNAAPKAAFIFFHKIPSNGQLLDFSGHLTLMMQPERLTDASVAWWKLILNGDAASKEYFVGASCKLCGKTADFDFGQKGLD